METPSSIEEVQQAIRAAEHVRVVGGGTKSALSRGATLSTAKLSGVLQYEPSEYTFTAMAGTPVAEVEAMLADNGQYLPFDPPLSQAGATLGGTVAAGLSGPGRNRYGGVRDFLLGVRFVTGEGVVVNGGGKVVKNAAGFDFPKLLVGSLGQMGVMVEMTFKVFPAPQKYATLRCDCESTQQALETMVALATSPAELNSLDFEPPGRIWLRVGGLADATAARIERLQTMLEGRGELIPDEQEADLWQQAREFAWVPEDHGLVKLPLNPSQISELETLLCDQSETVPRRYSVGGNVAWIAWPAALDAEELDRILEKLDRPAVALRGEWDHPLRGSLPGKAFSDRLLSVLDPNHKLSIKPMAIG